MILLSAGHYPENKGACNNIFCEYDIAVEWIERIKEHLDIALIPNIIVPTGRLSKKVKFINENNPTIAMELHFNSNVNANGSETLYCPGSEKGKELAEMVQLEFETFNVFQPNRGAKEGYYQMNPNNSPDYFLIKTKCVSIIIEPEFMYNADTIHEYEDYGCILIANALSKFYYKYK